MPGSQTKYDENCTEDDYFFLYVLASIIILAIALVIPERKSEEEKENIHRVCHCRPCEKKRQAIKIAKSRTKINVRFFGWIVFVLLVYMVSTVPDEHKWYDPLQILQVYVVTKVNLTVAFVVISCVSYLWYKSIKFSKDQVLPNTTNLYLYFFSKNPHMILTKVIMVLGASCEFDRNNNSEIVERPSDNEEVPMLIKQLPNLDEKIPERPLCFSYSVKARALLHAHFARYEVPPQSLQIDQMYVLKKCPALVNEMINILSQLVASAKARQRPYEIPRLDTVENCMKVSQMITQALESKASPLQQLPHIRHDMMRHFVTKRRNVQRIRDLVAMDEKERRCLLRDLNDSEYQDVMNVCATMPNVEMIVQSEVKEDEDKSIIAGSIVTVTVSLKRRNMMDGVDIVRLTGEMDDTNMRDEERAEEDGKGDEEEEKAEGGSETESEQDEAAASSKKNTKSAPMRTCKNTEHEEDDWEQFQEEAKKENTLETKKKESHPVHCPHFPNEKQEGWWLYVADRKNHMLVSAPVQILTLKKEEEITLKFSAPPKVGIYTYSVVLRSDSYIDFDQHHNFKLDVKEA